VAALAKPPLNLPSRISSIRKMEKSPNDACAAQLNYLLQGSRLSKEQQAIQAVARCLQTLLLCSEF